VTHAQIVPRGTICIFYVILKLRFHTVNLLHFIGSCFERVNMFHVEHIYLAKYKYLVCTLFAHLLYALALPAEITYVPRGTFAI